MLPFFVILSARSGMELLRSHSGGKLFREIALFCILSLVSIFIHYRGATTARVHFWNVRPTDVDVSPLRLWDWFDPPFLRGVGGRD